MGGDRFLSAYLMAAELPQHFCSFTEEPRFEAILKTLHSKTNLERINAIQKELINGASSQNHAPLINLTYVVGGLPTVKSKANQLNQITFDKRNTLLVDGFLELVALAKILGFPHPFIPTRKLSKQEIVANSVARQKVAQTHIQVTLIFNSDNNLTIEDMVDYYRNYSNRNSQIEATMINSMLDYAPINQYVDELSLMVNMDRFGGIAKGAIRLTKSDHGIVAESTFIKFVLGCIGGATPQNTNKVSDFNEHKGSFSLEKIDEIKPHIALFLETWLAGIEKQLKSDRDGFHYSPSLWLALGLIIHRILIEDQPYDIQNAIVTGASKLANVDYSKSAKHWGECDALSLDAKGREYKNTSGGGRPFRAALAKYLYQIATA